MHFKMIRLQQLLMFVSITTISFISYNEIKYHYSVSFPFSLKKTMFKMNTTPNKITRQRI